MTQHNIISLYQPSNDLAIINIHEHSCQPLLKYIAMIQYWLVVRNMNFMTFLSVGNAIIPTDFHSIIFQRGYFSTTNQIIMI